jgi:ribosome-associated protein
MTRKTTQKLDKIIDKVLDDSKAVNISKLDISKKSTLCDFLYIVTGTSNRHVKSIANNVVKKFKSLGMTHIPVEGENSSNWIIIDLGDAIIHIFQQEARDKYKLEDIWE